MELINTWAKKPLDFDPGTKWQYSNTNFVLAALIVEKASGMPFWQFLETRVLRPVGMQDVLNLNTDRLKMEPEGYIRNALGPLRPAILEAPGWYFGDADLAMPAAELLRWDISVMDRSLLKPASYDAFETEMKLKDGSGSRYGLGVDVGTRNGHRYVEHTGEVGGFVAANSVFPDDKAAVAVLTNQEASSAASAIEHAIEPLVLDGNAVAGDAAAVAQVEEILNGLQMGKINRDLFTSDCNFYFSQQTIGDFSSSLAKLGDAKSVMLRGRQLRGGMTFRAFDVGFADGKTLVLTTYTTVDGKIEQFLLGAKG
jgi:CubicO group peptidase (beta-lactamase class C family)